MPTTAAEAVWKQSTHMRETACQMGLVVEESKPLGSENRKIGEAQLTVRERREMLRRMVMMCRFRDERAHREVVALSKMATRATPTSDRAEGIHHLILSVGIEISRKDGAPVD